MLFQERIQKNQNLIGLAIISLFIVVNYYLILITVESFEGFNVSGHPIFYMVPFAFSTYLCFGIVLLMSVLFLWKKQNVFDLILVAGAQVGTLVGAITIIVGMIWSYVEWGYFWQWEPRQTATLIMWLAYVGLLIFRGMLDEKNPEKRGTLSAIFCWRFAPSSTANKLG
ncbi:MAG: cytochrome c biogenesis protein CcsA [Promethearchaeota archaeon]|jgi:heme exporter protein C